MDAEEIRAQASQDQLVGSVGAAQLPKNGFENANSSPGYFMCLFYASGREVIMLEITF